jgi:hypothetical protein
MPLRPTSSRERREIYYKDISIQLWKIVVDKPMVFGAC